MFESLLDYFLSFGDVRFEPLGDYVERWKDDNPVEVWAAANRALAGADWHEQREAR
jgi:hypothetical protein